MGLLENFANSVSGPPPRTDGKPPIRAMTAAGQRVNLSLTQQTRQYRMGWQEKAWEYRDTVPELQFVASFVRSSLGRLRVFAAERQPRGISPLPLDRTPEQDAQTGNNKVKIQSSITAGTKSKALAASGRLNFDSNGSTLLARLGENLEFAGEAYLFGEQGDEGENWSIRSVSEVQIGQNVVRLMEPGYGTAYREVPASQCELLRLWNPHPRYYDWPDSPIAALLETCQAMVLKSRRGRAHDRSRISKGKVLYLPDELSIQRAGQAPVTPDTEGATEDADPFMDTLTEFMMTPIGDDADPSAVVPIIVRGPALAPDQATPMKDVIGTIDLHNDDPKDLEAARDNLVAILARGIDLPPEVLTGIGDTNHWNGAVISAETVKSHIEPRAERMCDALTVAYLWPALKAMGVPRSEREKVCIWFDPSELMQDPDRAQAAKDAHEAGAISDESLRRSLGFTEEDKPSEVEKMIRTLTQGKVYEASVPVLIAFSGLDFTDPKVAKAMQLAMQAITPPAPPAAPGGSQSSNPSSRAQGAPTQVNKASTQSRALPAKAPTSGNSPRNTPVKASAERVDREKLHRQASARLARIDADLTRTLLAHAEATVGRAAEKVANSLRSQARRKAVTSALFPVGEDPREVLAHGGRALVAALDDETALNGAMDDLGVQFARDVAAAAHGAEEAAGDIVGEAAAQGLAERLIERGHRAWEWLKDKLLKRVRKVLYGEVDGKPKIGESHSDLVPVALIRGAVSQIGGLPPHSGGVSDDGVQVRTPGGPATPAGGPGTGFEVMDVMAAGGASVRSWEWVYPPNPRQHFHPHRELDGLEFFSWTDTALDAGENASWIGPWYRPGDHRGCLCHTVALWATPISPEPTTTLTEHADV